MNPKIKTLIKNFSYTITSNVISLIISFLVLLILPKIIGVEEYGYWQLYVFYSSYVGFFQFGWNDGIYLRYGGKKYSQLNKRTFFSQFWMLAFSQILIAFIIYGLSLILVSDVDKQFILLMISIGTIIVGTRAMILFIFQATNKIEEYARITILGRILYIVLILIFIVVGIKKYKLLIVADLLGKFISLLYAMYCNKSIVFCNISKFYFNFKEMIINICVGIKLMFSNIASMLIVGLVRFGIERTWDVKTFGRVSFVLSISNLMMLFIDAIGVVAFPILRRTEKNKLQDIYIIMRDLLMIIMFGILTLYYPLNAILAVWLPNYKDSLVYLVLIFPICTYEGKMSLLVNTYLKTLRKEKLMLQINLIALFLSLVLTLLTTVIFKNLSFAVASIILILSFRCIISEVLLSKMLKMEIYKDIFLEIIIIVLFICNSWFITSWYAFLIYLAVYAIYLLIKKQKIIFIVRNLKFLIKN